MLDVDVVSVRRLVTARPSLSRQAPGSGRRGLITAWPLAMASAMIPTQVRLLIAPRLQARPDKHAFGCPGSLTPRRLSRCWWFLVWLVVFVGFVVLVVGVLCWC